MNSYACLFVHFVWATWDRMPLITPDIQETLYDSIAAAGRKGGAMPLIIGGVADHVHVLARVRATTDLSMLAHDMKGSSSHYITHVIQPDQFFKWQGAYGVLSVSPEAVEIVTEYIRRQPEHHANRTINEEWERTSDPPGH